MRPLFYRYHIVSPSRTNHEPPPPRLSRGPFRDPPPVRGGAVFKNSGGWLPPGGGPSRRGPEAPMEPWGAGRPRRGRGRRRGGGGGGRTLLGLAAALAAALGLAHPAGTAASPPHPSPTYPPWLRPSTQARLAPPVPGCLPGRGPPVARFAGQRPPPLNTPTRAGRPRFVRLLPRPCPPKPDEPTKRAVLTHWVAARGWGVRGAARARGDAFSGT